MAQQNPSSPAPSEPSASAEQTQTQTQTQEQAAQYDPQAYADAFQTGSDDEARLEQAARAYAANLENSRMVGLGEPGDPRRPLSAEDVPAPRGFYGISSTYIQYPKDVMASNVGRLVTSYTFDSASMAADAQGNKLVYEGTTLQMSGVTGKVTARTTGTMVGVLGQRINVRDADADIGLVTGGFVNATKVWDNGVFGPTAAALNALTKDPLCATLQFVNFDI